jgi:hypothetical protein
VISAVGDLVVAVDGARISAIEEVTEERSAEDIVGRWRDQQVIGSDDDVEVWEAMPTFYFRRRQ